MTPAIFALAHLGLILVFMAALAYGAHRDRRVFRTRDRSIAYRRISSEEMMRRLRRG